MSSVIGPINYGIAGNIYSIKKLYRKSWRNSKVVNNQDELIV